MKKLIENWRVYNNFPYQIYCDMDGVLVNFEEGAVEAINKELNNPVEDSKALRKLYMKIAQLPRPDEEDLSITVDDIKMRPQETRDEKLDLIRKFMYKLLANNENFWANLKFTEDGKELWSYIERYNPYILSAPMNKGSERGKTTWINNNLYPQPKNIYLDTEKYNYAVDKDGRPNVLIDDFTKNTIPWEKNGGIAIR